MTQILLDKSHQSLIKAAIQLGDWLLTLGNVTEADSAAIKAVQAALKKLPEIDDGTLAMYGFSIERGNQNSGLVRGWDVSLEYFAKDAERQGGLEVFSSYIPIPETVDSAVLTEQTSREVYFHWPINETCSVIRAESAQQWIDEVSQPLQQIEAGDRLRIEIVHAEYYAEIEYPA